METEAVDLPDLQLNLLCETFDTNVFFFFFSFFLQDFVIYLMSGTTTIFGCCREHHTGEDEERLKVDILLFAPDVLPQHCCVRRLDSNSQTSTGGEHRKALTMLKPLHGAPVTRNGLLLKEEVELNPGDLVGLGKHYLFMFKDPTSKPGSLHTPPWMTRLCPNSDSKTSCFSCGSLVARKKLQRKPLPPRWRDLEGTEASLSYELDQEERVLQQILDMLDPSGNEPKLTPAFLLSLCIQHSASTFELTHFRQLLLQLSNQIQLITWVRTKTRQHVKSNDQSIIWQLGFQSVFFFFLFLLGVRVFKCESDNKVKKVKVKNLTALILERRFRRSFKVHF